MSEFSPEALRLLDAARAEEPTPSEQARIRVLLHTRLAKASQAPAKVSSRAKWKVLAGGVGLVAVAVVAVTFPSKPRDLSPPTAPLVLQTPPPAVEETPAPEAPPPRHIKAGHDRAVPASRVAPTAVAPTAVAPPASSLAAELALMTQARAALADHRAAEALLTLDQHAHDFPEGILREERAVARVLALCSLGRAPEAREEAMRLLASGTGASIYRAQLGTSCVGDSLSIP